MRLFQTLAPFAGALLLAAGCSTLDVPRADNYPATGQKKARAVHHWDVLADDVAGRTAEKIRAWPAGEHPIHIAVERESSFNESFRKLLVARLLERGVPLASEPGGTAVQLRLETQLVQHGAPVDNRLAMPWTRLAAGIGVARNVAVHHGASAAMGAGLALGLALDAASLHADGAAAGGPTRTEVLVSTVLESGGRYLASTADIYYIEPADAGLYRNAPLPPAPRPVQVWQVVAP